MRIRPLGTILAALLAAPLAPAAPAPASAPIRPVAQATASPEPTIALRAPVRVDVGSVRQALDTPGGAVAVPLPDRPDLIAVAERVAQAGADAWTATARGDDGSILYVASRSGVLIADVVAADGAVYQLRAAADGLHEVRLMDPEPFAPCGRQSNDHAEIEREGIPVDLASLAPPRPERVARGVGACVEDGSVVDVLVAYTPDVVAAEGGEANVLALIDLAILQTNEAFAASGVASVLRLVGAVEVPRTWSTSSSATILNDLATPGSGTLDEIHALRDAARADLVSLIVSNLDVCGRAYIAVAPGPTPMPELGFSVVSASCATAPIKAFAHEIGHNAGLAHARSVAPCEANGTDFAHGWADPGDAFRTIMASDGTGPVIGRFSSASLLYDGLPTGDAENDNAATLALTLPLVANYRSLDCNANGLCDADEIAQGASDLDGNGVIDSCDPDLNHNGVPDAFDIASAASADANANGIPDEAEPIRLYVDPAAAGDRLGDDWANARHDLQTALSIAERSGGAVQEIWVAAGIYTPAPAPYRARPFQMVSGVAIYGGFAGTEQSLAERDWRANPTILSGDLLQNDAPGFGNIADNSVSVVWASYTDDTAVLDGFFIEGGNCRYDLSDCWWTPFSAGGGIRCFSGDGVIRNCVIRGNSAQNGGGAFVVHAGTPSFERCDFIGNRAEGPTSETSGAAVYDSASGPDVTYLACRFLGNHSDGSGAGLTIICPGDSAVIGCLFGGNTAYTAAALNLTGACVGGTPLVVNSTFVDNHASTGAGGAIYATKSSPLVHNCVIWGNTDGGGARELAQFSPPFSNDQVITHSTLQFWSGSLGDATNDGLDPLLVDPDGADDAPGTADDNARLGAGSPAIDAGDNARIPAALATDLDGAPRRADDPAAPDTGAPQADAPYVDRGAYEVQAPTPACPGDIDGDNDTDVFDFAALADGFGSGPGATRGAGDLTGDGFVDVFDFATLAEDFGCLP